MKKEKPIIQINPGDINVFEKTVSLFMTLTALGGIIIYWQNKSLTIPIINTLLIIMILEALSVIIIQLNRLISK